MHWESETKPHPKMLINIITNQGNAYKQNAISGMTSPSGSIGIPLGIDSLPF